jgi:hypothetical protein
MTSRILKMISPEERARIIGEEIVRVQKEIEEADAEEEAEDRRELTRLYGGDA